MEKGMKSGRVVREGFFFEREPIKWKVAISTKICEKSLLARENSVTLTV